MNTFLKESNPKWKALDSKISNKANKKQTRNVLMLSTGSEIGGSLKKPGNLNFWQLVASLLIGFGGKATTWLVYECARVKNPIFLS